MSRDQAALWTRIASFAFDERPDLPFDFAARLCQENGWRAAHGQRVIDEYRRFLFLAMAAGHVVTPSQEVDEAWHLHLTYTRSYWDRMCRDVLGRPLHHDPATGADADAERARFVDLYERTKTSYARLFGEEPPADLWPAARVRFGAGHGRTAAHWIVPAACGYVLAIAATMAALVGLFLAVVG